MKIMTRNKQFQFGFYAARLILVQRANCSFLLLFRANENVRRFALRFVACAHLSFNAIVSVRLGTCIASVRSFHFTVTETYDNPQSHITCLPCDAGPRLYFSFVLACVTMPRSPQFPPQQRRMIHLHRQSKQTKRTAVSSISLNWSKWAKWNDEICLFPIILGRRCFVEMLADWAFFSVMVLKRRHFTLLVSFALLFSWHDVFSEMLIWPINSRWNTQCIWVDEQIEICFNGFISNRCRFVESRPDFDYHNEITCFFTFGRQFIYSLAIWRIFESRL